LIVGSYEKGINAFQTVQLEHSSLVPYWPVLSISLID